MKNTRGGNATSVVEYSNSRRKTMNLMMYRQERRWAAKAGPVTISYVDGKKKN